MVARRLAPGARGGGDDGGGRARSRWRQRRLGAPVQLHWQRVAVRGHGGDERSPPRALEPGDVAAQPQEEEHARARRRPARELAHAVRVERGEQRAAARGDPRLECARLPIEAVVAPVLEHAPEHREREARAVLARDEGEAVVRGDELAAALSRAGATPAAAIDASPGSARRRWRG